MTELLAAVIGTVLGFFLSEVSQAIRDRRDERGRKQSVRDLLSHEIDSNLNLMREFWSHVTSDISGKDSSNIYRLIDRFILTPLPFWRTTAFYTVYSLPFSALNQDELKASFGIYSDLDRLLALRNTILRAHDVQAGSENIVAGMAGRRTYRQLAITNRALDNNTPRFWSQCEDIARRLTSATNPITGQQ